MNSKLNVKGFSTLVLTVIFGGFKSDSIILNRTFQIKNCANGIPLDIYAAIGGYKFFEKFISK